VDKSKLMDEAIKLEGLEKACDLAIEKGWQPKLTVLHDYHDSITVTDPLFWQALGKALGWKKNRTFNHFTYGKFILQEYTPEWLHHALRYHELVLTGGSTEKFWKELLTS
jgi:hypothetical protein